MSSIMDFLLQQPSSQEKLQSLGTLGQLGPGPGLMDMAGSAPSGPTGGTGGTSNWENRAQRMAMNRYDYTPQEWNALDSIIERESGWDPQALNEGSGAYGIPQILPSAHPDANLQNDPMGQLRWLFRYIQGRYGGPMEALDFKNENNWY